MVEHELRDVRSLKSQNIHSRVCIPVTDIEEAPASADILGMLKGSGHSKRGFLLNARKQTVGLYARFSVFGSKVETNKRRG